MNNQILKKKDTVINRFGFKFQVEIEYHEKYRDWFMDSYNTAKMFVYRDATTLYCPEVEKRLIADAMSQLEKGGSHA